MKAQLTILTVSSLALAACSGGADAARGVDRNETLLSVSATGDADMRPDEARFQAGVQNWNRDAQAASSDTAEDIAEIVAALQELGISDDDIQTSTVRVQRIDWGDRRGQFQAFNTVNVRVRDIEQAGPAVTAATSVGANIVSGPDLRLSDPEGAANTAYAAAYQNALKRAEAYAQAAGMEVSRVLYIRDAGGSQGGRYFAGAEATAIDAAVRMTPPPPPVAPPAISIRPESAEQAANIMPGQTTSSVTVQVDFALREK
ncbi:SIMPL domain-containing protein [Erythrobacter ani]|uniref:SIMPL domain-containing protein n=1 Tax=Erythrobacter ani TaxID=2827235 RepID=A0ABS6SJD7_9SPHN|nr:SIMPL domain-containing protein [Erythrobacter ani]MBV7265110.1 SIMPL domain-containing protein [Erythrobacter ani]